MSTPKYAAFISYSHTDRKIAASLHRAIETYRIPKTVQAEAGAAFGRSDRLSPIFLDREELSSSSDLAESVRSALIDSEFLIVVCSPAAARSTWVNEEIRLFKMLGRGQRILTVIASGEPFAERRGFSPDVECFAPALRFTVVDGAVTRVLAPEPLAADLRRGGDARHAVKLKVIAGMLGVSLDELRHRDLVRRTRRLAAIGTGAAVGCVVMALLAIAAWVAREEAVKQRTRAEQKTLTAQRTADFLVSLFKVSDPTEARGNTVTARSILDRGARQVEESLKDEPAVRAELSATLGEVYTGLGLYKPALDLLSRAQGTPGQDLDSQGRETAALAELESARGNYDAADRLFQRAGSAALGMKPPDVALQTRVLIGRGEIAGFQEHAEKAYAYLGNALALQQNQPQNELKVRALEQLAAAHVYADDLETGEQLFEQALDARIRLSGETHPMVPETLNNLGATAYLRGDNARAEGFYRRALAQDTRVLGPEHPNVAVDLNNIALLLVERRDFAHAQPILEQAVRIQLAQRDATHDDLIFAYTNLGLSQMGLAQYAPARDSFDKALRAAVANNHRLHAPILTDIADLDCRTRQYEDGLKALDEARPLMAARYTDEPWRVSLVDNVKGACLAGLKRYAEAAPLLTQSAPVIQKKWSPASLYGHDAAERMALIPAALQGAAPQAAARRPATAGK